MKKPKISIIIPTYNEEKNIKKVLDSIKNQDYPQENIEIIIVDDNSTDKTVEIAKTYKNTKIVKNGAHDCEIGKSLGIQHAKYELLLFLDADNEFVKKNSISLLVKALLSDNNIFGAYPIYFNYKKTNTNADNYCALFGINDPVAFYLKKRDRLMWTEKKWTLSKNYEDKKFFYKIHIKNENEFLTFGSIGFLTYKKYILKTDYKPMFFHIDSIYELFIMQKKQNKPFFIAGVKFPIQHYHAKSFSQLLKKIKRNINFYYTHQRKRKFLWATKNKIQLIKASLIMASFFIPLIDAIKGFIKFRTFIWFYHPFITFSALFIYTTQTSKHFLKKILKL